MAEPYVVFTKGSDGEEVVIRTLVGEYTEAGDNHGRKVFQKVSDKNSPDHVEVFLYFWDERDGPAFCGWWFGNKLGGTQVWSRNASKDMNPPTTGWQIPWDGAIRETLALASKSTYHRQEVESKLQPVQEEAGTAAQEAQAVLEQVRPLVSDYRNLESIAKAAELLAPVVEKVQASQKKLADLQDKAIGPMKVACQQLAEKLRPVLTAISTENNKVTLSKNRLESEVKRKEEEEKRKAEEEEARAAEAKRREEEEKKRKEVEEEQRKKNAAREEEEREKLSGLLTEAEEKLKAVQESVSKAADAEGPFLMGVEELPLNETLIAVKDCETACTAANTCTSIARMFLATKLVEVKRFLEGPATDAQGKLKGLQGQLDVQLGKLATIKKNTSDRKSKALMREADVQVNRAEELANKVAECGDVLADATKLLEMETAAIRDAAKETAVAEVAASEALTEARKFITARQIEFKGKDPTSAIANELIKFQTRVSNATAEVAKFKRLCATVEVRLEAKKVIEDAIEQMKTIEEKVSKAESEVNGLNTSDNNVKVAEHAVSDGQAEVKKLTRFIEAQKHSSGGAKEELAKLHPRIVAANEALSGMTASLKAQAEKAQAAIILAEAEAKVKEAEDSIVKASEAEAPLLKDGLLEEEANNAQAALETAAATAQNMASGVKTFLAMKKLSAKKLSSAATSTTEELTKLQTRFESSTKRLSEIRRGVNERKQARVQKELDEKVTQCQQKLEAAAVSLKALLEKTTAIKPEEMKDSCEEAAQMQKEADALIQATRKAIAEKRDKAGPGEASFVVELNKLLDKLTELQKETDKQKTSLKEHELKFVAQQLVRDAKDATQKLESQLEATKQTAASLIMDSEGDNFRGSLFLGVCTDALKAHMGTINVTSEELFKKMSGEADKLEEAKFVAFLKDLPELKEQKDLDISEEHLQIAFGKLGKSNGNAGEVSQTTFLDQFRPKYVVTTLVSMTDAMVVKGGKTIRKLAVNEVIEALGDPVKDEVGLLRVKARSEKDGKEGFVTLEGQQGKVFMQPFSAYGALQQKIERALQELEEELAKTAKMVDSKIKDLRKRPGVLGEARDELLKVQPRINHVRLEDAKLKKAIQLAHQRHANSLENEKRRQAEAKLQATASAAVEAATEQVGKLEQNVLKAIAAAEELATTGGANQEKPVEAMESCCRDLEAAMASVPEVEQAIKRHLEALKPAKGGGKGPLGEARSDLVKMKAKALSFEGKCRKHAATLQAASREVRSKALAAVTSVVRSHALEKGIVADDLFAQLSKDGNIPLPAMREFIEKIPDNGLTASQMDLALSRYTSGISKLVAYEMLQEYMLCVKEIAITNTGEVKGSKTMRRLELGEVVQVSEAPKSTDAMGLHRIGCRALTDNLAGWASVRGNQGTCFLQKTSKPYLSCDKETPMQAAFESQSETTHSLKVGEVVEVLEGPRQEPDSEIVRVRVKCMKNGKAGWVPQKDAQDKDNLEVKKLLRCQASIALTDAFDVTTGKPLRKLEAGELMEELEPLKEDKERGMSRIMVRTKRDGKDGWVTMKGNQGTAYLAEDDSLQVCKRSLGMESTAQPGEGAVLCRMEEGELVEVLESKSVTSEGSMRVRGRNLSSGAEGWISPSHVRPWIPRYRCLVNAQMLDGLASDSAKPIRNITTGEFLEALATPVPDAAGVMHVRARAEKDSSLGFVILRDSSGRRLLENIVKET